MVLKTVQILWIKRIEMIYLNVVKKSAEETRWNIR